MPFTKGHTYSRWAAQGASATPRSARSAKSRGREITPEPDNDEDVEDAEDAQEEGKTQSSSKARRSAARSTPQNTPRTNRRRRQAGQPNYRIPDPTTTVEDEEQASNASLPSNNGTPVRGTRTLNRRGTRGGFRGTKRGRGGRNVPNPPYATKIPLDEEGNPYEIENDELVLPADPAGDKKIDVDGHLQGGREYRVRAFPVKGRGRRLYMLSTEPARCTGYRDSYLFFTKHPLLYKLILTDPEKLDLIDREFIPHSYKGRQIGVVTAHSVYREFGARIIVGGRKIVDDYKEAEARERGDVEGELAETTDRLGGTGGAHGNGAIGKPGGAGRRKAQVTTANWMLEHAREASRFNGILAAKRKQQNFDGVYDPQTNLVMWPSIMQPTSARWEFVEDVDLDPPLSSKRQLLNGVSMTNGDTASHQSSDERLQSIPAPPRSISSNFLVVDTLLQHPPSAAYPPPGPDTMLSASATLGPKLGTHAWRVADMSERDVRQLEMDDDARQALRRARSEQQEWTNSWQGEEADCMRGALRIAVKGL